jgi:hypothetical protein
MTLQAAIIGYGTKFWQHVQLYVALSRVKGPVDLCILLHDDMDDFTIRPPVNHDVVQILETIESSRALSIPQFSPGDNVESGVGSIDPSDATLAKELPCPDDYVDAPEDQIDYVPSLDHDAVEGFDSCPDEISLTVQIMSRVLEDQQVLRLNCLGDSVPQNYMSGHSVPIATLLRRVLQTCCAKCVSVTDERLPFRMKQQFMNSLFETRILLSRFLAIYRVYRQYRIPRSLQSQIIDEVIVPGLINSRNTCYVNVFGQLFIHILPLRLMIVV